MPGTMQWIMWAAAALYFAGFVWMFRARLRYERAARKLQQAQREYENAMTSIRRIRELQRWTAKMGKG